MGSSDSLSRRWNTKAKFVLACCFSERVLIASPSSFPAWLYITAAPSIRRMTFLLWNCGSPQWKQAVYYGKREMFEAGRRSFAGVEVTLSSHSWAKYNEQIMTEKHIAMKPLICGLPHEGVLKEPLDHGWVPFSVGQCLTQMVCWPLKILDEDGSSDGTQVLWLLVHKKAFESWQLV